MTVLTVVTRTEKEALEVMNIVPTVPGTQHATWQNECEVTIVVKESWKNLLKASLKDVAKSIREHNA